MSMCLFVSQLKQGHSLYMRRCLYFCCFIQVLFCFHSCLCFYLFFIICLCACIPTIPHICQRHHRRCLCKNFLSGVNFSRLSEKKCIYLTFSETFLVFLVLLVVFLGVKFDFRKSCQCKRNDKYEVCLQYYKPRPLSGC